VKSWIPALDWLPRYSRRDLAGDFPAGLTVGVMLIPQGMAYAMIAGLPLVYGLYAALIPQVVYAFLGSSRQLAVGPVAMDSLLVASGLAGLAVAGTDRYIELALLLALMMGGIQLMLGILRMGFLAQFLSRPVISGFTSAAALIIGLNQWSSVLGTPIERSAQLHLLLADAAREIGGVHLPTLVMALIAVGVLLGLRRWAPRIPGSLAVVVLGILAVRLGQLEEMGIQVVGSIPSGLPGFSVPRLDWADLQVLLPMAGTLALIAFMEAYSVAIAVAQRRGDHEVDADQELRALGAANVLGSMFGAYPTTGGFSRTAVNDRAGAKTGMSALISAAVIALTLTFLTPLFETLPKAVLGAIIIVAVSGLVDVAYVRRLMRSHREEAALLLTTFALTAFGGMVLGIASGVVLSLILTLYRSTRPHAAELGEIASVFRNVDRFPEARRIPGWIIVRYDGPLHYASQVHFKDYLGQRLERRKANGEEVSRVLLHAESIPYVDATATAMLADLLSDWEQLGIELHLAGAIGPVRDALERSGLMERMGRSHFHTGIEAALGTEEGSEGHVNIATQTDVKR
jgi:SulP family sulfate permease